MKKHSARGLLPVKFVLGLSLIATLIACGGGGSEPAPTLVAGANTSVAASAANATNVTTAFVAVAKTSNPVTFSNGFSGVDAANNPVAVTGSTTVAFSGGTASAPGFSMTNNGMTATGTTTFGSCTFTFSSSSPFPADHPWGPGKTLKVDPCSLTIPTAGTVANGSSTTQTITLTFGTTTGTVSTTVTVASNGSVSIGDVPVGSVTVSATTGAGS